MAGHSQFKNIMHRKGAQDAKRAKAFAKLAREIEVAARSGPDPAQNPRLRTAIAAARGANMPNDRINRAIDKATGGGDADNYEEIRYEGYGPGGVAVIVEALTDNRNRTASEIRSAFSKHGGNLGETNSVSFMFDQVGQIVYPADVAGAEDMFEAALEATAMGIGDVHVTRSLNYTALGETGTTWTVTFLDYRGDVPALLLDATELVGYGAGGAGGATVSEFLKLSLIHI